ncbi:hypothetical protein [Micromonospora sp. NPDC000442]|uniref:hypothetical protein n=1 Tax=Micromonospora sp. NPDC000442 TaxID=3364217 RepID=UPI0036A1475B
MGEVGAVLGLEVSRFGRSSADLTRLMELARLTDTLLIDTDGVYDLANVNDRTLLGLKGQMSEIELHFLDTITPEQIGMAVGAAEEVAERHTRSHRAVELAVQQARYEADRAERAFSNVEPENRLVTRTLESRWEARLAALTEAEAALANAQAAKPALPATTSLQALAQDLPRLWHAETTSPCDRKRLLRSLIADVTLLPEPDAQTMRIGVRWHTGATGELAVARPGPGRTPMAALKLIRQHGATHTSAELADMLNTAGLTTGKGKPFTAGGVARVRDAYKIFGPRAVAVQAGEVSVKQTATELGIPADAVYNWLRLGQVPARRGPSGRWCIPWDPASREIYQQKVAASFRLTPVRPTTSEANVNDAVLRRAPTAAHVDRPGLTHQTSGAGPAPAPAPPC